MATCSSGSRFCSVRGGWEGKGLYRVFCCGNSHSWMGVFWLVQWYTSAPRRALMSCKKRDLKGLWCRYPCRRLSLEFAPSWVFKSLDEGAKITPHLLDSVFCVDWGLEPLWRKTEEKSASPIFFFFFLPKCWVSKPSITWLVCSFCISVVELLIL